MDTAIVVLFTKKRGAPQIGSSQSHNVKCHWLLASPLPLITKAWMQKTPLPGCTAHHSVRETSKGGRRGPLEKVFKVCRSAPPPPPSSSLQRSFQLWFPNKNPSTQGLQSPELPSLPSFRPPQNCPSKSIQSGMDKIKCDTWASPAHS